MSEPLILIVPLASHLGNPALALRRDVFVGEQHVPVEEEFDAGEEVAGDGIGEGGESVDVELWIGAGGEGGVHGGEIIGEGEFFFGGDVTGVGAAMGDDADHQQDGDGKKETGGFHFLLP